MAIRPGRPGAAAADIRPGRYSLEPPDRRGPVIAIIGGGASGTLAAASLLRSAAAQRCPLRIALIDQHGRHGLGQAYATTHPAHLLNAPADRMSAVAGDPDHLLRWAAADGLSDHAFLPRQAYGRYLLDTLSDAQRRADPLARVTHITSAVTSIRAGSHGRPLRLMLADGCLDADIAVLATGSPPSTAPLPLPASPRWITDPWAPGALEAAGDGTPVVILGTGLTMLDVATAVTSGNRGTVVQAVSRHGLLPAVHRVPAAPGGPIWLPALSDTGGPVRLRELIWQVRTATASRPGHWQEVIDALRPHVPSLWRRLPPGDRQLFLAHVARYWEVHRHRMPPATARQLTVLRATGRLSVQAGRVTAVTEEAGRLRIRVDRGGTSTELSAGWLINATGPATDITRAPGPLLGDLFARGLARPDPLRLGIDASPAGAVLDAAGRPSSTLFTLGPPLRGLWYETTAIPEIRDQAAGLAAQLTAAIGASERPGSAA